MVWFILTSSQILTNAWHSSVYKFLIAAVAQETSEGYNLAGTYVKIGTHVQLYLMIPVNILVTLWYVKKISPVLVMYFTHLVIAHYSNNSLSHLDL